MNAREQYKAACRNYRMSRMNAAHLATDRFDVRWHKPSEFVQVDPAMQAIANTHCIAGSVFSNTAKYISPDGRHNNRLFALLRAARKKS